MSYSNMRTMKQFCVALLLAATSSYALAEWVKVDYQNRQTTYVDPSSSIRGGNTVKMWVLTDYENVMVFQGLKPYSSMKELIEYDCWQKQEREIHYDTFSGNMGRGQANNTFTVPNGGDAWKPIAPDSVSSVMLKIACNQR